MALCGCYHPTVGEDVPCTADFMCPSGQQCDTTRSPPTCVSVLGDAGRDTNKIIDSAIDAPGAMCQSSVDCTVAAQPFCQLSTHTCRACEADVECNSHLCSESAGTCVDLAAALYVAPAPTGSDANACTTEGSPCATISGALGKLTATRHSIRVANGTYSDSIVLVAANGPILVSGETASFKNTTINFTATGFGSGTHDHVMEGTNLTLTVEGMSLRGGTTEGVRMSGGGKVTLYEVELTNDAGGVDCNGSTCVVEQSSITGNAGIGIASSATGTVLTVGQSVIANNTLAGIDTGNTSYTIVNSIITNNLGGGVVIGTLGATHRFDFNTVADNGGATTPTGIRCAAAATAITNSIFSGNGTAPQIATNCSATYSLFTDTNPGGTGNVQGLSSFVGASNYHITASSAARNAADPGSGEATDIDGEHRPQGAGRDMGADEIP